MHLPAWENCSQKSKKEVKGENHVVNSLVRPSPIMGQGNNLKKIESERVRSPFYCQGALLLLDLHKLTGGRDDYKGELPYCSR